MQPLKLIIPGRYWDSFIYKGRLYLFGIDGDIRSVAWADFMSSWKIPKETKIAFVCAFQRSDYLYSSEVQDLLMDDEIRNLMEGKFQKLAQMQLQATEKILSATEKGHQDCPYPFPHADLELYMDQLYVGSAYGLYKGSCNKKTKYPISLRAKKMWDGPVLGLSASHMTLAMAAGNEGLFELGIGSQGEGDNKPNLISSNRCRDCGWAYHSMFASSDSSGYLAEFSKTSNSKYDREADRKFERVETASEIFGSEGYSWGTQDKLCQAVSNTIQVVKYRPWNLKAEEDRIRHIGSVRFENWKGEVVSAATTNFGVLIELESALVIFPSEGEAITLPGEPVNWRVFPRSRHYENQLHVIYEDRLEILSFNQDYLIKQEDKILGSSASLNRFSNRSISDLLSQDSDF